MVVSVVDFAGAGCPPNSRKIKNPAFSRIDQSFVRNDSRDCSAVNIKTHLCVKDQLPVFLEPKLHTFFRRRCTRCVLKFERNKRASKWVHCHRLVAWQTKLCEPSFSIVSVVIEVNVPIAISEYPNFVCSVSIEIARDSLVTRQTELDKP